MRRDVSAAAMLSAALVGPAGLSAAQAEPGPGHWPPSMQAKKVAAMNAVRIRLASPNGESVTTTLGDGPSARAFRSLLPLTVELTDYNATEKIADLPKRLPTEGEPAGVDPEPGDLAYYAPWGNLAIFYKDFSYSRGLVRLGRLDRIPDAFRRSAPVTVTIEAVP